ncbi:MAG: AAA family ATPase [Lactobacillaceae bacterium]|jgi:predicted AAA+ superfamily ATPase|nr:AAA family ATPase [Lactobacillaceae bacterium]
MNNPFNIAFDYNKASFISDDVILNNLISATNDENSQLRTTFVVGMRGSGKTSLLSYLDKQLEKIPNIIPVKLSSNEDLLDNIMTGVEKELSISSELKELNFALPGLNFKFCDQETHGSFQYDFETLLQRVDRANKTVVILIDEVQNITAQLRTFFASYLMYCIDELPIVVAAAGLPSSIDAVLNDESLTFLLRANRIKLQPLNLATIVDLYLNLFKGLGLKEKQAFRMAEASAGYPYLYQLIGHCLWEHTTNLVKDVEIEAAIVFAKMNLYEAVYSKVMSDLSQEDRELVFAINDCGGKDVATSYLKCVLKGSINQVKVRKACLNHWGITEKSGQGMVSFKLPYFKEFLDYTYD